MQEGAHGHQDAGAVGVVEAPDDGAEEGEEEDLQRRDPRDGARGVGRKRAGFVVLLEDADAWDKGKKNTGRVSGRSLD